MITIDAPSDLELNHAFAEWKKNVTAELKGVPFEKKLVTRTIDDIAVQPLYIRTDLADLPHLGAEPGEAPFLRGARPGGVSRAWQIAQEIHLSQPTEYNRALLANLLRGQDAVVLTPDDDTRTGGGAVPSAAGRCGIPLHTIQEFINALEAVDLRAVPVHLEAGADPRALASLYLAFAQKHEVPFAALRGSITGDPLGEAAAAALCPADLGGHYDGLADWTRWAAVNVPSLDTIGVNAAVWSDAGATATQELAVSLACAAEYVRALLARGLSLDVIVGRIRFKFSIGGQFFTEIAKFRAFRPLWTRLIVGFGSQPSLAAAATMSATTGRWNKTLLDPYVNLLRVTTEALSAVLGGCDSLHIAPFDEVSGKTSDFSRRIALNVHTLLAEEFGFASTADPAGGSWYVEKLTDQLARAAWTQFQDFERRGGFAKCLTNGYAQQLVEKARVAKASAVAARRIALIGTNLFPNLKDTLPSPSISTPSAMADGSPDFSKPGPKVQCGDEAKFEWAFPTAIEAAQGGSNVGELMCFFRESPREDVAIPALNRARGAEGFEAIRRAAETLTSRTGARPKVFLAKMGPTTQHKARADFSSAFFALGGFEVIAPGKFEDAHAAASAAAKSGACIAVLCSTDETYPALAPPFAQASKMENPRLFVVLAGLPTDPATVAAFRSAGFDEFIHARANAQVVLASFLDKIGAAL